KYKIKWNNDYKIWYLEDYRNLTYLIDYLENRNFTIYVTEKLYIVEGFITCWKCSKMISVYAFGALKSSFLDCKKKYWKFNSKFKMIWNILSYSQELESILKKNNMKISYSNTTKSYYLMNICQNCQAKQGEFFLFNEIDSIFSPNSVNEAKRLKIYEIPLLFDIGFEGEFTEIFSTNCSDINALIWFNAEHKTNLTYNINY
ncbi:conjugal transfer protein TraC, partial [Campylobacter coli]|nr:conjugal transfer protein TraC [Campylobacter coli]MEE26052.1 conjugal transfer protein TraC [Campylobacter jejuni]